MKAPSTPRSTVVSKAKTTKKTTKKAGKKNYTASQKAAYAWIKQHYPFPKTSAAKKATVKTTGKAGGVIVHPTAPQGNKVGTVKRTMSLNPHNLGKGSPVKLGRTPVYTAASAPRLFLEDYLTGAAVPAVVDFASQVDAWPMYGNDTIGDCTAACVGHQIQAWTRYTGAEVTVPQDDIIQLYSAVSGYDPNQVQPDGSNPTDQGANVQDVLTYWRKSGVPVAGHKILAFAQLKDVSNVKEALWMFGSVYLGINFPDSAMDQFNADQPWDVVPGAQIEGGHAIPVQYADDSPVPYQVVTWGKLQGMTQAFLDTYANASQGGEAWVIITDDWLEKNGNTPEGLNLEALGADLAALTGDPNPFPAPPSPVPAPPAPAPAPVPVPQPAPAPVPAPAPKPDPSIIQEIEDALKQLIAAISKLL